MKIKKVNENTIFDNFYQEYKDLFEVEDYDNYEVLTEVGQLTLKYNLSKENVKEILSNYDTSFDTHNFLQSTYDDWDENEFMNTIEHEGIEDRVNGLIKFLNEISEKNADIKVSAGDVLGYICGWSDITAEPEDEIETFE